MNVTILKVTAQTTEIHLDQHSDRLLDVEVRYYTVEFVANRGGQMLLEGKCDFGRHFYESSSYDEIVEQIKSRMSAGDGDGG